LPIPLDVLESVAVYHDRDSRHKFINDGMGFCIVCTNKRFECKFCKHDVRMVSGRVDKDGAVCKNCMRVENKNANTS
jgi:hypothetical protein